MENKMIIPGFKYDNNHIYSNIKYVLLQGPVAMLPVVYATTEKEPTMQSLTIHSTGM